MIVQGRGPGSLVSAGLAALVALAASCSDAPSDGAQHVWLQLGPDGERSARVITTDPGCPPIEIDGRTLPMQVRAEPDPPAYPVLTCEALVPAEAAHASVEGHVLPLKSGAADRLAIVGDTGCRIQDGNVAQDCDDLDAWPFAGLAQAVSDLMAWLEGEPRRDDFDDLARSIAAFDPDLIVHVGDYLYREDACPEGDAGCLGSPYGYNWETIEADFFTPAEPMFRVAPLALTRGNHESCDRAGELWFRFLDPRPYTGDCVDYTEPYAIEVGGLQLLMFDSSNAGDTTVDPSQAAIYRQQFEQLDRLAGGRSFFVTHRPLWVFAVAGSQAAGEEQTLQRENVTLQVASRSELPAGVEAVLSGHVHTFQLLGFATGRPPQVVVGNSGTELAPPVTTPLAGLEIAGATVGSGHVFGEFGFATLEAQLAGWRLTIRDMSGTALRECLLAGSDVTCLQP